MRHPDIVDAVAFAVPNIAVGEDIACAYTTPSGKPLAETHAQQFLKTQPAEPHGAGLSVAFRRLPHHRQCRQARPQVDQSSSRSSALGMRQRHSGTAGTHAECPELRAGTRRHRRHRRRHPRRRQPHHAAGARGVRLPGVQSAHAQPARAFLPGRAGGQRARGVRLLAQRRGRALVRGFPQRFERVGLGHVLLYVGGNIVVGSRPERGGRGAVQAATASTASITSSPTSAWRSPTCTRTWSMARPGPRCRLAGYRALSRAGAVAPARARHHARRGPRLPGQRAARALPAHRLREARPACRASSRAAASRSSRRSCS